MTGKDFSGPTPVIKAPTPPRLADEQTDGDPNNGDNAAPVTEQSTAAAEDHGEEIVGFIED